MSIFNYEYCDELLLHFSAMDIDLYCKLAALNKYYYGIINADDNYKSWISLLNYSECNFKNHLASTNFQNNLFLSACENENIMICNYLINKFSDIDIHIENDYAFNFSCAGNLKISKWLIELPVLFPLKFTPINIHAGDEHPFRTSCRSGSLETAKWLFDLSLQPNFTPIDIHSENEDAFIGSCGHGHLEVVKWLVELSLQKNFTPIDIHAENECAFIWGCMYGHFEVVKWLVELSLQKNFMEPVFTN